MMAYANKDTAFETAGAYNLDARVLFHFGYIVVSPAMAVTVAGKGSDYGLIALDSISSRLTAPRPTSSTCRRMCRPRTSGP